MCVVSAGIDWRTYLTVAAAVSLFYTAGMFLNDAFDAEFDERVRPERPIPAGDTSRHEVFLIGGALLVAGELLLPARTPVLGLGALLAGAILLYDARHKQNRVAPLIMGSCRGLVYLVAAAAAASVTAGALVAASIMVLYVGGLTIVAKLAGSNARWLVPLLIAGISILDAVVIALASGTTGLALVATLGFPLTLFLQRFVPGD
jgi:4-hydroxybenzoate polyprenyltransferase